MGNKKLSSEDISLVEHLKRLLVEKDILQSKLNNSNEILRFEYEKVDYLIDVEKTQRIRAEKAENKLELAEEGIRKAIEYEGSYKTTWYEDFWNIKDILEETLETLEEE